MNNRGGVGSEVLTDEDLGEPLTYPVDAFISREYAAAEDELLWSKVWQMAGLRPRLGVNDRTASVPG